MAYLESCPRAPSYRSMETPLVSGDHSKRTHFYEPISYAGTLAIINHFCSEWPNRKISGLEH